MKEKLADTVARAIVVLSVVSSAASILGFIALFQSQQPQWDTWMVYLTYGVFPFALVLAVFTIFKPSSRLVENVKEKIISLPEGASFVVPTNPEGDDVDLLQQGACSGRLGETVVVEFPVPYATPPNFEIASADRKDLTVKEVSPYHAAIAIVPYGESCSREITWFARGKPLYTVRVVELEARGRKEPA